MPKGGHRDGAGRPKGSPNKAGAAKAAEIAASGETPLDYMLRVMRDPSVEHERRDKLAAAAAQYVHPRLSSTDANVSLNDKRSAAEWRRDALVKVLDDARKGSARTAPANGRDRELN